MNLEPVIQSEVGEKEKNKYSILMHKYGISKMVLTSLFAGEEWRHRCRKSTCRHSRGGESAPNGKSSINIHTLSDVRWVAAERFLSSTRSPV